MVVAVVLVALGAVLHFPDPAPAVSTNINYSFAGGVMADPLPSPPVSTGQRDPLACATNQLALIEARAGQATDEHVGAVLILINVGRPCVLQGTPALLAQGNYGAAPVLARATPTGPLGGPHPQSPARISLTTGQAASALYEGNSTRPRGFWQALLHPLTQPTACPSYQVFVAAAPGPNPWSAPVNALPTTQIIGTPLCDLQIHPLVAGRTGAATVPIASFPTTPRTPAPRPTGPPAPPCRAEQLTANSRDGTGASAATTVAAVILTNRGRPCTLTGFPTLTGLDTHDHPVVQARPVLEAWAGATPLPTITLDTGQSAAAQYEGLSETGPCTTYTYLQVIPPDTDHPIRVDHPTQVCSNLQIGPLDINRP